MTYKRKQTHSEDWWANQRPAHILRCTAKLKSTGGQCRREAAPGTNVCDKHGALIPAVQAKAATRIGMSVDEATKALRQLAFDEKADPHVRLKAIQDILDRGGLSATQKVLLGVTQVDPVEKLFADILGDRNALEAPPKLDAEEAAQIEAFNRGADGDIVDAEVVGEEPEQPAPAPKKRERAERRSNASSAGRGTESLSDAPPAWLQRDLEKLL